MPTTRSPGRRLPGLLLMPIMLLALTGCVTTNTNVATMSRDTVRVACQSFQPIYWKRTDTEKTVQQIKAHNAVFDDLCTVRR